MDYVILDSTGNLVASFESEQEAMAEMIQIGAEDPEAVGEIALIVYDKSGLAVGEARLLSGDDLEAIQDATISFAGATHSGQNGFFPTRGVSVMVGGAN